MIIELSNAGKRFNRDWIFRGINYRFECGKSYAVTGSNGSGKSTLLQVIAGSFAASEGACFVSDGNNKPIPEAFVYKEIAIAAPYLELVEEMTAREFLLFHASFKPLADTLSIDEMISLIGLEKAMHKQIRYFSSGMKQRLKLAQAVFSNVPILLLDEPCTNLDAAGYALYHQLINDYCLHKLILVGSNDKMEYDFCTEQLKIADYK